MNLKEKNSVRGHFSCFSILAILNISFNSYYSPKFKLEPFCDNTVVPKINKHTFIFQPFSVQKLKRRKRNIEYEG